MNITDGTVTEHKSSSKEADRSDARLTEVAPEVVTNAETEAATEAVQEAAAEAATGEIEEEKAAGKKDSGVRPEQKKELRDEPKQKKEPAGRPKRKKKSAGRLAAEFFIKLGVTALLIWALLTFVVGIYVVHSNTGYPMVKDGDLCIIYRLGEIYNGDEVAYRMDGKIRFARVVAMPGDVVDISEESMTINGYGVFEDTVYPTTGEGALIQFPYTVPEGTFFVLNDYRSDVTDSRTYGAIPKTKVKGKVVFMMRRRGF